MIRFIYITTITLFSVGLIYCYYMTIQTNELEYNKKKTLLLIDKIKSSHNSLSTEVSNARMGLVGHYDFIEDEIKEINSLNRAFIPTIFPPKFVAKSQINVEDKINEYLEQTAGKIEGIEAFKSINSVIMNAEVVLPTKTHRLITLASENQLSSLLNSINTTTLLLQQFKLDKGTAFSKPLREKLIELNHHDQLIASFGGDYPREWDEFKSHISIIFEKLIPSIRAVQLADRPAEIKIINELRDGYISFSDDELKSLSTLRMLSWLVMGLMLIAIVLFAIFFREKSKHLIIQTGKAELAESQYKQRTEQQFAIEPLAAFGECLSSTLDKFLIPFTKTLDSLTPIESQLQSLKMIFAEFDGLYLQGISAEPNKKIIQSHINRALTIYKQNPALTTFNFDDVLNNYEQSKVFLERVNTYMDMASSKRLATTFSSIINDEANDLMREGINGEISLNLNKTPIQQFNVLPIKRTIRNVILRLLDVSSDKPSICIKSLHADNQIQAVFEVEIDNPTEQEYYSEFSAESDVIRAQGGDLSIRQSDNAIQIFIKFDHFDH